MIIFIIKGYIHHKEKNNRMKINYRIIPLLFFIVLAGACKREVTIVEFNDTYEIDKDYVSVDIPEKVNYNPNNIILYAGATEVILNYIYDEETGAVEMPDKNIPVRLKLKKPLLEPVNVVFKENRELLQSYTGEQLSYKDFPEGTFADAKITVPAGQTVVEGSIELKNVDAFKENPGYLTGLEIILEKAAENVVISKINYALYVKVNKSTLKDEDNVMFSEEYPDGCVEIDRNGIKLESDYASGHLSKMLDGSNWSNWWMESGSKYDLVVQFPKNQIGAILLQTWNTWDPKTIRSVKVSVSADGGNTFFEQGVVVPDRSDVADVYIKFIKPHEINAIRLYDFVGYNAYIDIHELYVYGIEE